MQKSAQRLTAKDLFAEAQALFQAGKIAEAASAYRAVVTAEPAHFSAWMNLGTSLRRLGHLEAAVAAGRRALALRPDNAGCLTNLGNALVDNSRIAEALAAHREAARLAPDDRLVQRNLAVACREAGLFAEAFDHFKALEKYFPDDSHLPWEQALCLLYQGDFAKGWPAFESRWKLPAMSPRHAHLPRWTGGDIKAKKLLIAEEQGFGDTLLCSRYLPQVIAMAGEVTLACKKPLHRLFSDIKGLRLLTPDEAEKQAGTPGRFDLLVAMMSLPGIFKTDLTNIPPPPILKTDVTLPPMVELALRAGKGRFKVGIIWSGSVTFANNRKRAVGAERFLPFADIPGIELYSLQKGPREHDLRPLGGTGVIHEIAPHFEDFAQTAAVLKRLDLVIMTDSSVAHLAGSLDVPVWNLLHDRPYWLYLQNREDTPWYRSMKLIRQETPGDWDGVFARTLDDLKSRISAQPVDDTPGTMPR